MKPNQSLNQKFPKWKVLRYVILLIVIGVIAGVVLVKMTSFESTLNVIKAMPFWLLGLAIVSQICSYLGSGFILSAIMSLGKSKLSIGRGALITMAANSMGLVAGGWVVSAATTYFWIAKNKEAKGEATLTGILPSIYNTTMLIMITILGISYLLINHDLSQAELITYNVLLGVTLLVVLLTIYGFKKQNRVERLLIAIMTFINRFSKQKKDPAVLQVTIGKFYQQISQLTWKEWLYPGLGSVANITFDILTLYFCFIAAGHPIKLGILVSGYSLALLIGRAAFFMPGGVGVIEGGMTAIFTSLGIASHFSVVAVLSYRLLSFWLPILLGFLVTIYLQRTSGKKTASGDTSM